MTTKNTKFSNYYTKSLKKKKKLIRDCNGLMYELACKFKNVVKLLFFVVFLALLEK